MPPIPGLHFRADDIAASTATATRLAESLVAEISSKTGLVADPIFVADEKKHAAVYADLRDGSGYGIHISIYPAERSVFLDVRDFHLHFGRNVQSEERVQKLSEIARKIVDSHLADHPLKPWIPKQGILGP